MALKYIGQPRHIPSYNNKTKSQQLMMSCQAVRSPRLVAFEFSKCLSIVHLLSVGGGTIQVNYLVLGECISFLPQSSPSFIFIDGWIYRGWQL